MHSPGGSRSTDQSNGKYSTPRTRQNSQPKTTLLVGILPYSTLSGPIAINGSQITQIHYWQAAVSTSCCSVSCHWHMRVQPQLVTLAVWGIALVRCPRTYPVQAGSHSASLSAEQGSWVPGRLLYTSLSRHHLRSATWHHLTVPRYRLRTFGCQAFSVTGPTVWNSLPDSLCDLALNSFRQLLKTNLCQHCHSAYTVQ